MRIRSLAFRLVIASALWIGAAVVAGGILLSAVFRGYAERAFDARLMVLLDALVAASSIDETGKVRILRAPSDPRFEQPYSGWYWQIADNRGPVLRSRSLWDQVLSADYRVLGGGRFQSLVGTQAKLRIIGRDVTLPGSDDVFHYIVSGDRREIDTEIARFNATLIWSLGALASGLVIAVLIQVRYGLKPLRRVRAALSDVASGGTSRLEGRYPSEVEPLVSEINLLLDSNREVVERARTHVGNLAHALKTPLSVLSNAAAEGRASGTNSLAETVRRQVDSMRRQVDHYLVRARTAASGGVIGTRTEVIPVIEDLARTLERIHAGRDIAIAVEDAHGLYFRGERQDLEEMLGNLIDNACKWARSRVRVSAALKDGRLVIAVDDDGPGLGPEQREAAFGRGHKLDEAVPGSGLGLSIVRDIAALYGGEVELSESALGGLRAAIELPAAIIGASAEAAASDVRAKG
ncbi:MAG: ATP-binding protein [Alphaproteobacteria bacterium]